MKRELIVIGATILVVIAVIAAIMYSGLGSELGVKFNGNYAFNVEIKDPSFNVVNVNGSHLIEENITNYSYNSTSLEVNLSTVWHGFSSNYVYELVNTLSSSTNITLADNFTNGAVFTYLVLPNGQAYYNGVPHDATFEVLLENNLTGNYTTKMVVAYNITADGSWHYTPASNETVISTPILGDGLPIANGSVNLTIPANYYVYVGIGYQGWVNRFIPPQYNSSQATPNIVSNLTSHNKYESGSMSI